jgi:hypothetical protein
MEMRRLERLFVGWEVIAAALAASAWSTTAALAALPTFTARVALY